MTQSVTQADALHESTHWAGGQTQQTMSWCFAAASAIVQAGFGTIMTQAQIAHDSLMSIGATGQNPQSAPHAVDYREGVENLWAEHGLADTSWTSVGGRVQQNATLWGYLGGSYGAPQLAGRTYAAGGRLSEQQMIDTLNNNGLIIAANVIHYKVINAWRRVGGVINFRVYNPIGGANDWVSSDTAREVNAQANTITTFRVTA
jgi:hypothetical protein